MTDYVVGPDGALPDEAGDIDAHALLLGSTPPAPVRTGAAGGHGLPIVLCSAGDPDTVLDAMAAGRAAWVRATLDLH